MSSNPTLRFVDDILELSGLLRRDAEQIGKIPNMSDQEIRGLAEDMTDRQSEYTKELPSIISRVKQVKGPNAVICGGIIPDMTGEPPDEFMRKAALYYNRIMFVDMITGLRPVEFLSRNALVRWISAMLASLLALRPWVAHGIVELVPSIDRMTCDLENSFEEEDVKDIDGWVPQALKFEDRQLEGGALVADFESYLLRTFTQDAINGWGGIHNMALKGLVGSSSRACTHTILSSALLECSPVTGRRREWRLLGYWAFRKAERFLSAEKWQILARNLKAGRAWLTLNARELGVLTKLPPSMIAEVRESAEYSFRHFREDLGDAVDQIEGLELDDEKSYREAVTQVWNKVRESAREIKKDSDRIEKKMAVDTGAAVVSTSLVLGLMPFGISGLVASLIGGYTGVSAGRDLLKQYLELRELKKSSGYFLVELEGKKGVGASDSSQY